MFFRHKWLTSSGRLHDPWVAGTLSGTTFIEPPISVDSDIRYICDDLSEVLKSNSKYIKHRISLRLAAILIYGTCVIYQKKTLELLNDCTYEFIIRNPAVINEKINLTLHDVPDSEIDSLRESLHLASLMYPDEQDSQSTDVFKRFTKPSSSCDFNTLFESNEVEAVRRTVSESNSPQIHGTISDLDDGETSYIQYSPYTQHMIIDDKTGNSSYDLKKIYNCDYSLPFFIIGRSEEEDASNMSPVATKFVQTTDNNQASNVLKIHDTYNNFMLHLTFEDCPEWNLKKKTRKFPNRVDKYKEFRSAYWRSQKNNVKCHLRCQTAQDDIIDIRRMPSTRLFSTMHNHTNRNKRLSPLYRRNLLTRKTSLDKDIFETWSKRSPETCRQQTNISNISEADLISNNENSFSANQISADIFSSPPNNADNLRDLAKQLQLAHNITFRKNNLKKIKPVSKKSSFDTVSSRISKESQKIGTDLSDSSELYLISDHKEKLSSSNLTLSESEERVSHEPISNRGNSQQSLYVLLPNKDATHVEDMKIFLGSDFNLKNIHILNKITPKMPQTRRSHISKFHSTNAKDSIKRHSFYNTNERSHSSEWNEFSVIEKLNNLWIHGIKVSFKMLLQQGPLGPNSSSATAKVFSTLINLKKSHFINILKNNDGEIELITKGPALWLGTTYQSYSI